MNQILGISEEHDAGVAYLEEGKLVWAANEERYTREKFQRGIPVNALRTLKEKLIKV
jgi:predicted NodU family carbamoyl transferase